MYIICSIFPVLTIYIITYHSFKRQISLLIMPLFGSKHHDNVRVQITILAIFCPPGLHTNIISLARDRQHDLQRRPSSHTIGRSWPPRYHRRQHRAHSPNRHTSRRPARLRRQSRANKRKPVSTVHPSYKGIGRSLSGRPSPRTSTPNNLLATVASP